MYALPTIFLVALIGFSTRSVSSSTFSQNGAKKRFEDRFNRTCGKYPFVQQYIRLMESPTKRYTIFVFHEAGAGNNGGLGDRLGGMVSAVAFSIRTKRTLLITGDKAFEESFRPYHPNNDGNKYTWSNWDWAGWKQEYASNMTYLRQCVNPRPAARICTLDKDLPQQVVKFRSNRAFLCRWVILPEVYRNSGLKELGIDQHTDLFEVAGCMLRLAIWPTTRLWNALDKSLKPQFRDRPSTKTTYQVGFHFRCGDNSFSKKKGIKGAMAKNPECYFDPSVPWKGTAFMDDKSLESPVDSGRCGRKILDSLPANMRENALAYIASDNPDSSQQINTTVNWPFVVLPPRVCHVDLQASFDCTLTTSLHWFMLSLSDKMVMQGLIQPPVGTGSMFEDISPITGKPQPPVITGAISGFSRFASIYGLDPDVTRYGIGCEPINKTALAKQTQGNWLCNPRRLY
jgi:hypothetical protein